MKTTADGQWWIPTGGSTLPELASEIARAAHGDQRDKAGRAYIDHPRRVAARLAGQGESPETVAAGWLHDVLEDTAVSADDLLAAGVPAEVVAAVESVTHHDGESQADYAERVRACPMGLKVKLADLADNSDPARLALLDDQTRQRLTAKYERMSRLLSTSAVTACIPAPSMAEECTR